ncbi:hypothetical protein UB46_10455 [Burkholderiaceae bacterium 16]|nr:hypothetical protein UB46_10455 [Burkholderiaceae bacterium 16]
MREPDTSEWNFTSALLGSFERRQAKVFAPSLERASNMAWRKMRDAGHGLWFYTRLAPRRVARKPSGSPQ